MTAPALRTLPANANITPDPPVNYDAEQAMLGALLANNGVYFKVCDFLRAEHFADALHGRIYEMIASLVNRGETANPVTLYNLICQDGAAADYPGGANRYLVELAQAVVTVLNAEDYGRAVRDLWVRRKVIDICLLVSDDARTFSTERDVAAVIETAEDALARLSIAGGSDTRRGPVALGEASAETLQRIESAMKTGHSGLTTGLANVNKITFGLHDGDLIILAGATSMGKTTLGLNISDNVAQHIRRGIAAEQIVPGTLGAGDVLFGSLEMTRDQLVEKFYATRSGISTHRMRSGAIDMVAFHDLAEAHQDLTDMPFKVDDTVRSVAELRAAAKRMQRGRGGLSMVVVDYLQLMDSGPDAPRDNRVAQVSSISRGLKKLALELRVPVIALCQLSRKLEEREDKRPILADLRESGAIEQDADIVLFVYRDEYYLRRVEPRQRDGEDDGKFNGRYDKWKRRMEDAQNKAELICAKNRHGPLKTARLHFDGVRSVFTDLQETDAETMGRP